MSRPKSDGGTLASRVSSRKSGSQCLDIVEKGPVYKNGELFQKIRRCPMCLLTNSDPHPVEGKDGLIVWHVGSNTSPRSRTDRLCWLVFTIGGFADEHGDIDNFLAVRKTSAMVMSEWTGAYKAMLSWGEDLPERLGKAVEAKMEQQMSMARKQTVNAFRKTQRRVKSSYRAVLRSKYEKTHPGKIERKKLKTKWITADHKRVEVVFVRKTPKDEWDVDMEEVEGAEHIEEIDDGETVLRKDQALGKFKALSARAGMTKEDIDNSSESDSDDGNGNGNGNVVEGASAESSNESELENCDWACRSLLDDDLAPASAKAKAPVKTISVTSSQGVRIAKPSSLAVGLQGVAARKHQGPPSAASKISSNEIVAADTSRVTRTSTKAKHQSES